MIPRFKKICPLAVHCAAELTQLGRAHTEKESVALVKVWNCPLWGGGSKKMDSPWVTALIQGLRGLKEMGKGDWGQKKMCLVIPAEGLQRRPVPCGMEGGGPGRTLRQDRTSLYQWSVTQETRGPARPGTDKEAAPQVAEMKEVLPGRWCME